ncbi:MAG: ABC transporter permease subunit [Polyangiaceae bacterium]
MTQPRPLRTISVVTRKELSEHWRDRRSLLSALLVPVMGPLVFSLMFTTLASWARDDRPMKLPVDGASHAPGLIAFLKRHGATIEEPPAGYESKVVEGSLDVVLVVPPEYPDEFSRGERAKLRLYLDSSRNQARRNITRAEVLLDAYATELGAQRLVLRGVDPQIASPIKVETADLATAQKTSASLLGVIPMFLLLAAFAGGMHVAIDTTAGERERGSLEPLLLNPIPRSWIILGKWSATVVAALSSIFVSIAGFMVAIRRAPLHDLGIRAVLDLHIVGLALLATIPLALFSSALQMMVATFARTFKEAQTYLSLLVLAPTLPGVVLTLSPVNPSAWMMLVPTLGQSVLVHSALRGEATPWSWYAIAGTSSLVFAAVILRITTRLLASERIVFGR